MAESKFHTSIDKHCVPHICPSLTTVHNTGYRLSDFNQNTGASYREVIDFSDWDRSTTLNSPGESGDPNNPHYRDLFPLWADSIFVLRPAHR